MIQTSAPKDLKILNTLTLDQQLDYGCMDCLLSPPITCSDCKHIKEMEDEKDTES